MSMAEDGKGDSPPVDIESQMPADEGGNTMMDGCLRCLDYFHPMGPSTTAAVPSSSEITRRRIASVALSVLLVAYCRVQVKFASLTETDPKTPMYLHIATLYSSHAILVAACYFHFKIASLKSPTVLHVPLFCSRHRMGVRGGRVQRLEATPTKYYPQTYWIYVMIDLALMGLEFFVIDDAAFRAGFALWLVVQRCVYVFMEIDEEEGDRE